jgi:hypothetical protein
MDSQTNLVDAPEEHPKGGGGIETVYVVASNYADDPHPHIEGVFADEEPARELEKKCGMVTEPPHPVAWWVFEEEIQ